MAFSLGSKLKKKASAAVTSTVSTASTVIHSPGPQKASNEMPCSMSPNMAYLSVARGQLKFRFADRTGNVLIYDHWQPDNAQHTVDILYYRSLTIVNQNLLVHIESVSNKKVRSAAAFKEHRIKYHTYKEIIDFCRKFSANQHRGIHGLLMDTDRRFAIRLAEFCGVSIEEIDHNIKCASQLHSVGDTIHGIEHGMSQIVTLQAPLKGSKDVIGTVAQNTAKLGVTTVHSVHNTNVTKDALNASKNAYAVVRGKHNPLWPLDAYHRDNILHSVNGDEEVEEKEKEKEKKTKETYIGGGGAVEGDNCPICYANGKSHAMQCGHVLCWECIQKLDECPFCKQKKQTVLKLYDVNNDEQ